MSGYFLYQSSRLESFPRDYSGIFNSGDPLSDPVYTVVQNAGLGAWLTRYLASLNGAVMGPRILMPEQALRNFAEGFPSARRLLGTEDGTDANRRGLLFMDGMKLTVYKALEEVIAGDDPVFEKVRDYAPAGGTRLWQLADTVAGIFYHYGMNCLPLVESWDTGKPYPRLRSGDRNSEAWQQALWCRIFRPDAPYTHLSHVLSEVMGSGDVYDGSPARVILFGSMFLGETGLRFFRHIAGFVDVHHFILTPSRVFTGGPEGELPVQGDLFTAAGRPNDKVRTAFLRENGRLSAGFAGMIPSLNPDRMFTLEDDGTMTSNSSEETPEDSLLERLKDSISRDEPLRGSVTDDGSLAVHNVSGVRREVEVLKDRILEALRDDPDLAPTQIGVLAPDIGSYAPYIESIFPGSGGRTDAPDHLPFNLTDLPVRSESPYPAAFRELSLLPGSRFGRTALLRLFANPCFSPVRGDPEATESWIRFVEDLNIRWGVDADHRSGAGASDPFTGSWERAFERLLSAYYHGGDDDTDILPANLPGDGDADRAGRLMNTVRRLSDELREVSGRRMSLRDWTLEWESIAERWLRPRHGDEGDEDEADRLRIKGAFRDLTALCDDVGDLEDFGDGGLPWSAFSALLEEMTRPANGRKGRYLGRGVTCASLKPMRAIPFRRIYVLGLNEGVWPGREYLTGFDLRESVPGRIDLSRESVDRFAFLESIYSAGEHLSLFFLGRNPERGEAMAPSAPLAELLEYIGDEADILIRKHPLAPYDSRALEGSGTLATTSPSAAALAESRRQGPVKTAFTDAVLPPVDGEDRIEWRELLGFLRNPVRFFYSGRMGASWETAAAEESENDVLEASFLDWWKWRDDVVERSPETLRHSGTIVSTFRDHLRKDGSVADTPMASLQADLWSENAGAMAEQLDRLLAEGLDLSEPFTLLLDPMTGVFPDMDSPKPGELIRIPAPLVSPAGAPPARICGRIDGLRMLRIDGKLQKDSWTLLDFVSARTLKASHNISSWLKAVLAGTALAEGRPRELRVFRLSDRSQKARRYLFPTETQSVGGGERRILENPVETLRNLLHSYRGGQSSPTALYPELADKLARVDGGNLPGDRLPSEAARAWASILSDSFSTGSRLRDCSWRRRFLGEPDFTASEFRMLWENIYRDGGIL